jgi:GT2 family glycosyltransferase
MTTPTDVLIVIVGINSWTYLKGCLESLNQTDWGSITHKTVYVDNDSRDRSPDRVRVRFPTVEVILNNWNAGFGRACNQGASTAPSTYVFYLNNDTILYPDTIPLLVRFLEETPKAGAAGPRLLWPDLTDQWSARRFPTWKNGLFGRHSLLSRAFPQSPIVRKYLYKDEMRRGQPFRVDWIPGSCTLARREALNRIGGIPEELHYWSDAVFCDRLQREEWEIYLLPTSKLIHFEGKGSGIRTYRARRWLIEDFHHGAFAFYCEHNNLGPWSLMRWFAALALGLRCRLLTCANWLRARRAQQS